MKLLEIQARLKNENPLSASELEALGLIKKERFNNGSESYLAWFPLREYWVSGGKIFEGPCFAPTGSFPSDESVENLSWQQDMFSGFWGIFLAES